MRVKIGFLQVTKPTPLSSFLHLTTPAYTVLRNQLHETRPFYPNPGHS